MTLIGSWNLDDAVTTDGSIAPDLSGLGHNGIYTWNPETPPNDGGQTQITPEGAPGAIFQGRAVRAEGSGAARGYCHIGLGPWQFADRTSFTVTFVVNAILGNDGDDGTHDALVVGIVGTYGPSSGGGHVGWSVFRDDISGSNSGVPHAIVFARGGDVCSAATGIGSYRCEYDGSVMRIFRNGAQVCPDHPSIGNLSSESGSALNLATQNLNLLASGYWANANTLQLSNVQVYSPYLLIGGSGIHLSPVRMNIRQRETTLLNRPGSIVHFGRKSGHG